MTKKLGIEIILNKRIKRVVVKNPKYYSYRLNRFSGNPLIESLDFNLDQDELFELLSKLPYHHERDVENKIDIERYNAKERSMLSVSLTDCCLPDDDLWFKIYTDITDLLLDSYVNRNPLSADAVRNVMKLKIGSKKNRMNHLLTSRDNCSTCSKTGVISGVSGMGKTFVVESIFSLIPNVIIHVKYNGKVLRTTQITWMKIECPPSGTIKGICLSILAMFDYLLGLKGKDCFFQESSYLKNDDDLQLEVALLASAFNLGALVVDDAENMMNNDERENLTAFLNSLVNCVGVFVIYVGTSRLRFLFTSEQTDEFRTARRLGTGFFEELGNYNKDNEFWIGLVNMFWVNIICDQKPCISEVADKDSNLTYEDIVYNYTLGVPAILAYFMFRCNRYTSRNKSKKLTKAILNTVYNEDMIPLHDGIDALRTEDHDRYNDLWLISKFIFEEVPSMDDSQYKERIFLEEESVKKSKKNNKSENKSKHKKQTFPEPDFSKIQEKIDSALGMS